MLTADRNDLAGNVRGEIAREEYDDVRDLPGRRGPRWPDAAPAAPMESCGPQL